jgi:hypothetical protein
MSARRGGVSLTSGLCTVRKNERAKKRKQKKDAKKGKNQEHRLPRFAVPDLEESRARGDGPDWARIFIVPRVTDTRLWPKPEKSLLLPSLLLARAVSRVLRSAVTQLSQPPIMEI